MPSRVINSQLLASICASPSVAAPFFGPPVLYQFKPVEAQTTLRKSACATRGGRENLFSPLRSAPLLPSDIDLIARSLDRFYRGRQSKLVWSAR